MKKLLLQVLVVIAFFFVGTTLSRAQAVYNICSVSQITDTSGTLYDTGGPTGGYQVNEDCSLLIQPACATTITLTFVSFDTELNYDYFYVYDGTTTNDPLLVTGNGQALPSPSVVTATSGSMLIVWHSDISITYNGFEVNWHSTIAPSVAPNANFIVSDPTPPLGVDVQFTDASSGNETSWLWDFGDSDTSHRQNPTHAYAAPGTYTVTFIAFSCDSSDTITQTVTVQAAPEISVAQTGFTANAQCGDSVAFPLDISNIGGGDLVYNANGSNVGAIKVLAMSYGCDQFAEYPHMLQALAATGVNYTLTQTATTDPGVLNALLIGKNVLLIGEQETGVPSVWTNLGPAIRQFLNNGGSVIFCGSYSSEADCMFNTGVFSGTFAQDESINFSTINNVNPLHPLMTGILSTFTPPSATYSMNITNPDKVACAVAGTNDVVTYRYYGSGKAIFIAFDFYSAATESQTILGNAITWGGENALPAWISLSQLSDTVGVSATSSSVVTFHTTGLPAGTYYANIGVASNDPNNPVVLLPCTLTVSGFPIVALSDTCVDFGAIMQHTTAHDTVQVINNGCDTLFISSITANDPDFIISSNASYLLPGQYTDVVVSFSASTVGSFSGTITVANNDHDTTMCVSGSTFPAPAVTTSTNAVSQSLRACDDLGSNTFDINNTGGSDLTWTIGGLPSWVIANPSSGTITAGTSVTITLDFYSTTLAGGNYTTNIQISSNDPLTPMKTVACTLSVDFNPCLSYTFTSNTCTGFSQFTTSSINTPTSYHWDFGDGDTSNVANPNHGFPANGNYTVTVIGCNASGCDTVTQSVQAIITGPRATSCYPVTTNYCCGIGITEFRIGGTPLDNITPDAIDGYQDYTCTDTATLLTNLPYQYFATTGFTYSESFKMWLDINNDGTLDPATEEIASDNALTNHSGWFTIPDAGAVFGQPLRLRIASDYTANPTPTPCLDLQYGQIEDYSVFLQFYDGINELSKDIAFMVYPNPFDHSTNIEYNLQSTSKVSVEVFNVLGSKVISYAMNEMQQSGKHSYSFSPEAVGVYYVKITSNGKSAIQKIVKM
ncbi:MAG: PKD domain-containing protein [Bacteroidia bacterium]